jgi:hypothetical protein
VVELFYIRCTTNEGVKVYCLEEAEGPDLESFRCGVVQLHSVEV